MNKNILKKTLFTAIILVLCAVGMSYAHAEALDSISVNITVTDITDVNNPFNVLIPRQSLEVKYKPLSTYGSTFTDIEAAEGITYLHAVIALHEKLYGEGNISSYLMLDNNGETHLFMGKSIDSIMYKNGDDIFTLPQNVQIKDGDEINISIYTAGHQQRVATFDKSVLVVPIGEEITLNVSEHYDSPVENTPISGAYITDENGILLFDEYGGIVTTDDTGSFSVAYDAEGTYILSIMPEINYYMTGELQEVITYVPQEVTKTFTFDEGLIIDVALLPPEVQSYFYPDGMPENEHQYVVYINCPWGAESEDIFEGVEIEYTTTELVEVIEYIPDEPKQMITYTPPFVVINVTDDLIVNEVYFGKGEISDGIYVELSNYENKDFTVWCASYDADGRLLEVQASEPKAEVVFAFGTGADNYKVFFWDKLTPLADAYTSK